MHHSELTVLRCSSGTVATWPVLPKKQAIICVEAIFPQKLSLDLARLRRPTRWTVVSFEFNRRDPRFVTFYDLINVFWSTAIVFFLCSSTRLFFGAILETNDAVGRYAQKWLYLTICHMTTWHYQFTHGINVLWHNGCFWRTLTCLLTTVVHNWILLTVLLDDALSANKFKLINAFLW